MSTQAELYPLGLYRRLHSLWLLAVHRCAKLINGISTWLVYSPGTICTLVVKGDRFRHPYGDMWAKTFGGDAPVV